MPNPFIKLGRMNQSTKPQDHENQFDFGNTNMDEYPADYMEHVAGDNHPYRGSEPHGVADTVEPRDVQRDYQATQDGVTYMPKVDDVEPIPVRIVQQHGRQLIRSRVHKFTWDGQTCIRVLPRNESRTYACILNSGNQIMAIGHNNSVRLYTGFLLNAANPRLEIHTQDELWSWNEGAAGNNAEIQIYEEYAVEV